MNSDFLEMIFWEVGAVFTEDDSETDPVVWFC